MTYRFAFFYSNKPRAQALALAISKGAKRNGDVVDLIPQDQPPARVADYDGGMVIGIAQYSIRLRDICKQLGKHYIVFDKGYLNREAYYRFSVDAWQPLKYLQRVKRPPDRYERINKDVNAVSLSERKTGEAIMFASCCQSHSNYHKVGDLLAYNRAIIADIKRHTDRPVIYRPNPGWWKNHPEDCQPIPGTVYSPHDVPFRKAIKDVHLIITHGSSAAFSGIMRGVPAMTLGECIANPLSMGEEHWDYLDNPYWPTTAERRQFVYDAMYCQWTQLEFEGGLAWKEIRDVIGYLRGSK